LTLRAANEGDIDKDDGLDPFRLDESPRITPVSQNHIDEFCLLTLLFDFLNQAEEHCQAFDVSLSRVLLSRKQRNEHNFLVFLPRHWPSFQANLLMTKVQSDCNRAGVPCRISIVRCGHRDSKLLAF
jgi:hypothetical protein